MRNSDPQLPEAPPVAADNAVQRNKAQPAANNLSEPSTWKVLLKKLTKRLSSLPLAIALMATIAVLSGLGTVVPQNKPYDFYIENYPDVAGVPKVLGFLTYDLLLWLQLDHIYTADYFYLMIGLLGACLAACTYTRQWPAVKVAQRWRFVRDVSGLTRQGQVKVLPAAAITDLGAALRGKGYQVFLQGGALYAFKGLAGKVGPIGVHVALLLTLAGTAYSGFGGWKGSVMVPEGGDFYIADFLRPTGFLSSPPRGLEGAFMHVNSFSIDYRPDGQVAQFYSDLSLMDGETGREKKQQVIYVNKPFRAEGVTMYQTDWSLAALQLRVVNSDSTPLVKADSNPPVGVAESAADSPSSSSMPGMNDSRRSPAADVSDASDDSPSTSSSSSSSMGRALQDVPAFRIALGSLEGRDGIVGKMWGTFLPITAPTEEGRSPKGITMILRDPQAVTLYDSQGAFAGVRRPGSGKPLVVDGVSVVVDQVVGATGLEIKVDPGVPWVYAGFGGLMITVVVSYLSHSQVWALQAGPYVYVAGRSNRAKFAFEDEMDKVMDSVPERADLLQLMESNTPSPSTQDRPPTPSPTQTSQPGPELGSGTT